MTEKMNMGSAVSVARFAEFLLVAFLGIFIFALPSYAVNGRTTYSAKIYKPDGYPLESASVNFRFSVLDPTGSCVLYIEDYSSVNMIGGGGLISLTLGNGVRSYPSSGTLTFAQVFDNAIPMFNCQTPGAYNPTSTDNRKIVMQFNDSSGWQTLPAMAINAVPYAMYATKSQDSLTLNGKADTAFVQKNSSDIPTCAAGQMLYFNGASFSCVAATASGTVTSVAAAAPLSSSGGSTPTISITQATSSTNGYLSSTDWTTFNNKQSATSGAIIATLGYTPLDSVNQSGVVSGAEYTKVTVDGKGRVTSGAQLTNSDVTTALGYTPANSATTVSSQWVTTGSNIYYNTGNVGIGISSPSAKFEVSGTSNFLDNVTIAAGRKLGIGVGPGSYSLKTDIGEFTTSVYTPQVLSLSGGLNFGSNGTGNKMVLDAIGNVGIGTTSPSVKTQISGTNNGALELLRLENTDANGRQSVIGFKNTGLANPTTKIYGGGATNGGDGTFKLTLTNPSGTEQNVIEATNSSGIDPKIIFSTVGTERMRIDYLGNVGIGTASPGQRLSIVQNANHNPPGLGNNGGVFGIFKDDGAIGGNYGMIAGVQSDGKVWMQVQRKDGTAVAYDMLLQPSGGNVGIGTAAPTATLHLKAGTAAANTAPLKFTSGTLLTSPESGTVEYDGTNLYFTDSTNTRRTITSTSGSGTYDNAATISNSSGNITMYPNGGAGSVIVSSTIASTSSNTGALVVKGGLGVAGTANVAQNLNVSGSSVIDGSLKLSSMTSGSVLFAGANGTVTQDNSNFYWDGANKRLGIGTTTPIYMLDVSSTTRLSSSTSGGVRIGNGQIRVDSNADAGSALSIRATQLIAGATNAQSYSYSDGALLGSVGAGASTLLLDVGSYTASASALRVTLDGTGLRPIINLADKVTGSSTFYANSATGNVGIGTTTPAASLHVVNSAVSPASAQIIQYNTVRAANNKYGIEFRDNANESNASIAIVQSGAGNNASALVLATAAGTGGNGISTPLERMRIDNAGNVGIGTTAPISPLQVKHTIRIDDGLSGAGSDILGGSSGLYIGNNTGGGQFQYNANRGIDFWLYNTGGSWVRHHTFTRDGNVGIGTAVPTATLHLKAGTAAANTAPLKFTSGTLLTSPESGTIEYDGANLYFTDGTNARRTLAATAGSGTYDNASLISNASGNITMYPNGGAGSVIVSATTASTNSSTGALVVKGGLGVAGSTNIAQNLNVSGSSVIDGSLKLSSMTSGSVLFAGASGTITQDNSNFYWDGANKRLGIGTTSPQVSLDNRGTFYTNVNYNGVFPTFNATMGTGGLAIGWNGESSMPGRTNFINFPGVGTGGFSFHLASSAGAVTSTPVVVINGSGNVGIGLSAPLTLMHLREADDSWNSSFRMDRSWDSTTDYFQMMYDYEGLKFRTETDADGDAAHIVFKPKNSEAMRIADTGNVGIGTTSPSFKLDVKGSIGLFGGALTGGTFDRTVVYSDDVNHLLFEAPVVSGTKYNTYFSHRGDGAGGAKMVILGSGNVGIGTSAPGEKLHVSSGNILLDNAQYIKQKDDTGTARAVLGTLSDGTVTLNGYHQNPVITAVNGATYFSGGSSTNMTILTGGNIGIGTTNPDKQLTMHSAGLDNYIHITSSMTGTTAADGVMIGTGTTGDAAFYNRENTNMLFLTNNIERVRIDNLGNVGIGTMAPAKKLDVNGDINLGNTTGNSALTIISNATTGLSRLVMDPGTGNNRGFLDYDNSSRAMILRTNEVERMRIDTSGNVGIGTASPGSALQVGGGTNLGDILLKAGSSVAGDAGDIIFQNNTGTQLGRVWTDSASSTLYLTGRATNSPDLTLNSSGNVGIGTTAPTGLLHLSSASSIDQKIISSAAGGYSRLLFGAGTNGTRWNVGQRDDISGIFNIEGDSSGAGAWGSRLAITLAGNVGIGVTAPTYQLQLSTDSAAKPGTSTWTIASDKRLKDIRAPFTRGMNELLGLNTIYFNYKKDNRLGLPSDKEYVGIKAQDVQKVIPEAVSVDEQGYLHVTNDSIIWTAVNAIKELYKKFLNHDEQIAELKAENAALKAYLCGKDPAAPICK